ncbi:MAG: SPOR domain-containing protein [Candidatus Omnitrophica bacterium]|nr:SPOR domain-containing protein [Candidatus Omnitrophota bacterium]
MQGELFEVTGPVVDASKFPSSQISWMDRFHITLRLDHIAVGAILALVLYVLVFSFGVEKGKRFALEEQAAKKRSEEEITKELAQKAQPDIISTAAVAHQKETSISEIRETSVEPSGRYAIQLITYTSKSRAEKETDKLTNLGYHAFILPGGNGKFFQVCIDGFENMGEAKEKLIRLRRDGFAPDDAYIRPIKGSYV